MTGALPHLSGSVPDRGANGARPKSAHLQDDGQRKASTDGKRDSISGFYGRWHIHMLLVANTTPSPITASDYQIPKFYEDIVTVDNFHDWMGALCIFCILHQLHY